MTCQIFRSEARAGAGADRLLRERRPGTHDEATLAQFQASRNEGLVAKSSARALKVEYLLKLVVFRPMMDRSERSA
jgi:hypothetical protein